MKLHKLLGGDGEARGKSANSTHSSANKHFYVE